MDRTAGINAKWKTLVIAAILWAFTIKTHADIKPTLSITNKPARGVIVSMPPTR